jgi:hypothetical protein
MNSSMGELSNDTALEVNMGVYSIKLDADDQM